MNFDIIASNITFGHCLKNGPKPDVLKSWFSTVCQSSCGARKYGGQDTIRHDRAVDPVPAPPQATVCLLLGGQGIVKKYGLKAVSEKEKLC